jgi:hypothetical protein
MKEGVAVKRLTFAMGCALIAVVLVAGTATLAQTGYEFKLGFKALADQIPSIVGQPLENEHYGPNGDSLQQTATGLMVWRKADNWTAFTDGSRTWINGPYGVQVRGNDERFPWEAQMPAAPPTPGPTAPVAPSAPSAAAAACMACHSDFQAIAKASANYVAPSGVHVNPHTTVDPSITKTFTNPHASGVGIVNCTYCHRPHPVPLTSTKDVPTPNVDYCFTACHHLGNFERCSDCH